jgi:hypothetical protein
VGAGCRGDEKENGEARSKRHGVRCWPQAATPASFLDCHFSKRASSRAAQTARDLSSAKPLPRTKTSVRQRRPNVLRKRPFQLRGPSARCASLGMTSDRPYFSFSAGS